MSKNLLEIKNLKVNFYNDDSIPPVINGLSLEIKEQEIVALVGGSGSGKTITGLSILRLLPFNAKIIEGEIIFEGQDLLRLSEDKLRQIRGRKISYIFQEPLSALNPVFTIGFQIREVLRLNTNLSKREIEKEVQYLLKDVEMPRAQEAVSYYPHQLSAGMRQRAIIAQAIASKPKLLIADEATSNLDVTIQAKIMDLFLNIKRKLSLSILLITHDFGLVEAFADKVAIIYQGKILEFGRTKDILNNPNHSYTKELLEAVKLS
ncbi:MAG: ABC transporter ATP-binding protein [Candidatus Omnitrophota bacterium]|nr:ABC transporter ATP-binding protein [Candidatus Omnitrophota bacterium]